jgi:tripartite-type tricarboxylate transporter receptor subunit TctC
LVEDVDVTRSLRALLSGLAVATLFGAPASAEPVADFYKGKTVSLIVSSSPGGGYDTLARTIAKHLGKHVPGNPGIVVRNMPGAGGIVATNHLFNIAAKDGTVIGGVQNNTPFEPLIGTKEAKYDATKFNWLGSPSIEVGILVLWNAVPVDTLEQARTREITVGASGANSTPSFYARLLNETLGTKLKIISGYPGQTEAFLAMERGEIDGYPSVFYSSLMSTKPTWIKEKKIKLIVQYGPERQPEIAAVPFAPDLVTSPEDKLLMEAAFAPLALGRPYLMPPGAPADRVEAMRAALAATFKDAEFRAEAETIGLDINNPRTGPQTQEVVERAYKTPAHIVERLQRLQQQK